MALASIHQQSLTFADVALQAPEVRQQAASELASELHEAYTIVYNGTSSHGQVHSRIEHTPSQIKTILGIA